MNSQFERMYKFEDLWNDFASIIAYIWAMATLFFGLWYDPILFVLLVGPIILLIVLTPKIVRLFWSKNKRTQYERWVEKTEERKKFWEDKGRREGWGK